MDESCNSWTETFLTVARNCIPNKVVTVRPSDKPFYTSDLRKKRRKKNIAHRKAKKTNAPADWENFRKLRNDYNDSIKTAKANSEKSMANSLRDRETLSPKTPVPINSGNLRRTTIFVLDRKRFVLDFARCVLDFARCVLDFVRLQPRFSNIF